MQELPIGWYKEISMLGETFYHFDLLNYTTSKHPMLKCFKMIFKQVRKSKHYKKSPKREEVREKDLKKVRQSFATKTKSSFIMELQQPIETVDQDQQYIDDIVDLKEILEMQSQKDFKLFQKIQKSISLQKALKFYEQLIGENIEKCPEFLKLHPAYLSVTPNQLIDMAFKYDIDIQKEIQLLWIPRILKALPLPPMWTQVYTQEGKEVKIIYQDNQINEKFEYHPGEILILLLLNKKRKQLQQQHENWDQIQNAKSYANLMIKDIKFLDQDNNLCLLTNQKLQELYLSKKRDSEYVNQIKCIKEDYIFDVYQELQTVLQLRQALDIQEQQLSDSEIQSIANQCFLKDVNDKFLYKLIYEFQIKRYTEQEAQQQKYYEKIRSLEKQYGEEKQQILLDLRKKDIPVPKIWIFRKTQEGQFYWLNIYKKEISKVFPYLRRVRHKIQKLGNNNRSGIGQNQEVLKNIENYFQIRQVQNDYLQNLLTQKLGDQGSKIFYDYNNINNSTSLDKQSMLVTDRQDFKISPIISNKIQDMLYDVNSNTFIQDISDSSQSLNNSNFNFEVELEQKRRNFYSANFINIKYNQLVESEDFIKTLRQKLRQMSIDKTKYKSMKDLQKLKNLQESYNSGGVRGFGYRKILKRSSTSLQNFGSSSNVEENKKMKVIRKGTLKNIRADQDETTMVLNAKYVSKKSAEIENDFTEIQNMELNKLQRKQVSESQNLSSHKLSSSIDKINRSPDVTKQAINILDEFYQEFNDIKNISCHLYQQNSILTKKQEIQQTQSQKKKLLKKSSSINRFILYEDDSQQNMLSALNHEQSQETLKAEGAQSARKSKTPNTQKMAQKQRLTVSPSQLDISPILPQYAKQSIEQRADLSAIKMFKDDEDKSDFQESVSIRRKTDELPLLSQLTLNRVLDRVEEEASDSHRYNHPLTSNNDREIPKGTVQGSSEYLITDAISYNEDDQPLSQRLVKNQSIKDENKVQPLIDNLKSKKKKVLAKLPKSPTKEYQSKRFSVDSIYPNETKKTQNKSTPTKVGQTINNINNGSIVGGSNGGGSVIDVKRKSTVTESKSTFNLEKLLKGGQVKFKRIYSNSKNEINRQQNSIRKVIERIKKVSGSTINDVIEEEFQTFERQIYEYFIETIGQTNEVRENMKLIKKESEAVNIDSLIINANTLGIKLLAERETDLIWIAAEYILHPLPHFSLNIPGLSQDQLDNQQLREEAIGKIKLKYFKKLVEDQRDKRNLLLKDKDIIFRDKYFEINSNLIIFQQGEFWNFNFYTKDKVTTSFAKFQDIEQEDVNIDEINRDMINFLDIKLIQPKKSVMIHRIQDKLVNSKFISNKISNRESSSTGFQFNHHHISSNNHISSKIHQSSNKLIPQSNKNSSSKLNFDLPELSNNQSQYRLLSPHMSGSEPISLQSSPRNHIKFMQQTSQGFNLQSNQFLQQQQINQLQNKLQDIDKKNKFRVQGKQFQSLPSSPQSTFRMIKTKENKEVHKVLLSKNQKSYFKLHHPQIQEKRKNMFNLQRSSTVQNSIIDTVKEEKEREDLEKNITSQMSYHYYKVLLHNYKNKEFPELQNNSTSNLKGSSSWGYLKAQGDVIKQQSSQKITPGKNDFRNMSPRSLSRYGHRTHLNLNLAKKIGLIQGTVINRDYSPLNRQQINKLVFSQQQL